MTPIISVILTCKRKTSDWSKKDKKRMTYLSAMTHTRVMISIILFVIMFQRNICVSQKEELSMKIYRTKQKTLIYRNYRLRKKKTDC